MLLGDKELLEKEVSTVFQQAGASHVLVTVECIFPALDCSAMDFLEKKEILFVPVRQRLYFCSVM